jgi:hypothetical protein
VHDLAKSLNNHNPEGGRWLSHKNATESGNGEISTNPRVSVHELVYTKRKLG